MALRTDTLDLGRLGLQSGAGKTLDLHVSVEGFTFGGEPYEVTPREIPVRLDISRTTGNGYAMRLRFSATVSGPCMRCLAPAAPEYEVDAREIEQPSADRDTDLSSPYVDATGELDVSRWVHDALALAIPDQITCRPDCRGLCPRCGANLNDDPDHAHEPEPDPRWAKLSELKFE